MSSTQHAPGPCQHRNVDAIDAGVGFCIDCEARFLRGADGSVNTDGPDLRAAPDLLAALRAWVVLLERGALSISGGPRVVGDICKATRAAIARAEGRPT